MVRNRYRVTRHVPNGYSLPFPNPTTHGEPISQTVNPTRSSRAYDICDQYTLTSQTVLLTLCSRAYDTRRPVHCYLANGELHIVFSCLRHMMACTPLPWKQHTPHCTLFPRRQCIRCYCARYIHITIIHKLIIFIPYPTYAELSIGSRLK